MEYTESFQKALIKIQEENGNRNLEKEKFFKFLEPIENLLKKNNIEYVLDRELLNPSLNINYKSEDCDSYFHIKYMNLKVCVYSYNNFSHLFPDNDDYKSWELNDSEDFEKIYKEIVSNLISFVNYNQDVKFLIK